MHKPLVSLTHVKKSYGTVTKAFALRDVSLSIESGEFVSILGPSGSGKSTLLNMLGALDRPSEGEVFIGGSSLSSLDSDGLAMLRQKHLGFVFQFHHLLPDFSAIENVLVPTWIVNGTAGLKDRREAEELLSRVGLEDFFHRKPGELSGGQQQRVAIARALARKRSILLADEPTGNLDTKNSQQVFELLRDFNRRDGITVIVITHDTRLARFADRIIEIVDGLVQYDGRSDTYRGVLES